MLSKQKHTKPKMSEAIGTTALQEQENHAPQENLESSTLNPRTNGGMVTQDKKSLS